jgi:SAM-dependent methyltransferase
MSISTKGLSVPATARRVLELLDGVEWKRAKLADVGAGRGVFCELLGERLRELHGLDPRRHVFACDLHPELFAYEEISCAASPRDGRIPFADARFDAVVSIEVIEHVEDPFFFLRELARIAKPGGQVIVTTPNVLNVNSRLRTLATGFPALFDPLPLGVSEARLGKRIGAGAGARPEERTKAGHIQPVHPYYLAYAALRAGLEEPELSTDRIKASGLALATLCAPLLVFGRLAQRARLERKSPEVHRENADLLAQVNGWRLLAGRTTVLRARKPLGRKQGRQPLLQFTRAE